MRIYGRVISRGIAEGEVLLTREPITFLGGVDPGSGIVIEKGHELEGEEIKDRILIFPKGKGSTVGSYVIYQMKKNKTAPRGIINVKAEEIIATGAIISGIPMMDSLEKNPLEMFKTGDHIVMNAEDGYVEVGR
jgi:hypothetical protein